MHVELPFISLLHISVSSTLMELNIWQLWELSGRWPSNSVAAIEEEGDSTDDVAGGITLGGHLQSAQNLFSIQVEVQRSLNCTLRVRVWLLIRDPSQSTSGKLDDLGGLASNLSHLSSVKGTALQEESLNLDGTVDIDATLLER